MAELDDDPSEPGSLVRPYLMTGGRTTSFGTDLPVETLVVARDVVAADLPTEQFDIVTACADPVAVAEIAARVCLPLGVARVLVSDLAALGRVEVFDNPTNPDIDLVRRLIDGVRAL